ncbi:MAG: NAD(P)H-dependent oxidoreductase [Flavobacteriaceae bacterium]|nr:NAD(P)H-dependent oxidoreductase [Flavobacteriaceae bacterium]
MSRIIAFAGSNSSTSVNYQLVKHTVGIIQNHEVQLLNMANFPFPMFSVDLEKDKGYSNSLIELRDDIKQAVGLVLSVNEHNGNPSAYCKNVFDWLSRLDRTFLDGTKVLLMSTSPGKRGGAGALGVVEKMLPGFGGEITATFSLPSFFETFEPGKGIKEAAMAEAHHLALDTFLKGLT